MISFWFIPYLIDDDFVNYMYTPYLDYAQYAVARKHVKIFAMKKVLIGSFGSWIYQTVRGPDPEQRHRNSLTGRKLGSCLGWGSFWVLSGFFIAGCGAAVVGLGPVYPPLEKKTFAMHTESVEVDSLRPTFQWQPLPRGEGPLAGKVDHVTYELRVWKTIPGKSGQLVYARSGLSSPCHELEEPLEPSSKYLWSVRAHFILNDRWRVSEWGMAGMPLRNEAVPNRSCFRFRTPAAR